MTVWYLISTLELSWCVMNDQDTSWFSGVLVQCLGLERLDLNRNKIRTDGTDSLEGVLGQYTGLTHLDIRYNSICQSPGAEERLTGVLTQCPAMVHLNFKVPQAGIDSIRSKLTFKIFDEYANILKGMYSTKFHGRPTNQDDHDQMVTAPGGPSPPLITSLQTWRPNNIRRQKEKEKKGIG